MFGTSFRTLGVSPRSAATIALVTRFFAPFSSIRPRSGLPPLIVIWSTLSPTAVPWLRASSPSVFK